MSNILKEIRSLINQHEKLKKLVLAYFEVLEEGKLSNGQKTFILKAIVKNQETLTEIEKALT